MVVAGFLYKNAQLLNVLQLGLGFLFNFFGYNSSAFIEQVVIDAYADRGRISRHAGYTALAIGYCVFAVGNIFAAPIVRLVGIRTSMTLGGIMQIAFHAGFLFLNEYYLYAATTIAGLLAGPVWTAQGAYLSRNSNKDNAGKHSGIFWSMSTMSQLTGGIFLLFAFGSDNSLELSEKTVNFIYACFTVSATLAVVVFALLRAPVKEVNDGLDNKNARGFADSWKMFKSTIKLATDPSMRYFIIVFIYCGIGLMFVESVYHTCIGFTMRLGANPRTILAWNVITLGSGQVCGSLLCGMLSSRYPKIFSRSNIVVFASVINLVSFAAVFLNLPGDSSLRKTFDIGLIGEPQLWIALSCGFAVGFADALWNTQIMSYLVTNFSAKSTQAFSLFRFSQGIATSAALVAGTMVRLEWLLAALTIFTIAGCAAFLQSERLHVIKEAGAVEDVQLSDGAEQQNENPKQPLDSILKSEERVV